MDYLLDLRKKVGSIPLLVIGANCFIINENDEVLFIRRNDNNLWGIVAGSMEIGETIEQTAIREIKEETGLTVNEEDLEYVKIFSGEDYHHIYPNGDECYFVSVVFVCRKYSGNLIKQTNETLDAKFFKNIPTDVSPNDKLISKGALEIIRNEKTKDT